jgi:uncharacterized protein (DUF1697 family)
MAEESVTYFCFLRGINVSGHNPIKMPDLRKQFENLGFSNVVTYIQSGNVIFSAKKSDCHELAALIEKQIADGFGLSVSAIVFEFEELLKIFKTNPFTRDNLISENHLYFTLMAELPEDRNVKAPESSYGDPDKFVISRHCIYIYCPGGYGRTKLNNSFFERKLKVIATTRNFQTIHTMLTMAG